MDGFLPTSEKNELIVNRHTNQTHHKSKNKLNFHQVKAAVNQRYYAFHNKENHSGHVHQTRGPSLITGSRYVWPAVKHPVYTPNQTSIHFLQPIPSWRQQFNQTPDSFSTATSHISSVGTLTSSRASLDFDCPGCAPSFLLLGHAQNTSYRGIQKAPRSWRLVVEHELCPAIKLGLFSYLRADAPCPSKQLQQSGNVLGDTHETLMTHTMVGWMTCAPQSHM